MIFKLQRPLNPQTTPLILIYDEEREHEDMIPMTKELRKLFGDEVKIFLEGELVPAEGGYTIELDSSRKLPNPHW